MGESGEYWTAGDRDLARRAGDEEPANGVVTARIVGRPADALDAGR